jgi:hypothetical protein
MQRRADIFGEDVEEFRPERWENWTPRPWQYVPFNGGPRICLGQQFALTEMGFLLCRYVVSGVDYFFLLCRRGLGTDEALLGCSRSLRRWRIGVRSRR